MILMREMILTLMKNKLMRKINLMIKIVFSYKILQSKRNLLKLLSRVRLPPKRWTCLYQSMMMTIKKTRTKLSNRLLKMLCWLQNLMMLKTVKKMTWMKEMMILKKGKTKTQRKRLRTQTWRTNKIQTQKILQISNQRLPLSPLIHKTSRIKRHLLMPLVQRLRKKSKVRK